MTTSTNTAAALSTLSLADRRVAEIKTRRFGVEIETVGSTRENIAKHVAAAIPGATVRQGNDYYQSFYVTMADGREWRVMSDASLSTVVRGARPLWTDKAGEVVSPVLTWADMPLLQTVIRAIRKARATVDASCGVHVHVDGRDLKANAVARLVTLVDNYDEMFDRMLSIAPARRVQWCRKIPGHRVAAVRTAALAAGETIACRTDAVAASWYGPTDSVGRRHTAAVARTEHYQETRYHGLNLHSLFFRGTVEFRWFNGTLHAGEVKAYVALALALVSRAIHTSAINPGSGRAMFASRPAVAFGNLMHDLGIGLADADFANVRRHLGRWLTPAATAESIEPAELPPVRATRARRAPAPVTTAAENTVALDDAAAVAASSIRWENIVPAAFTAPAAAV